MFDLIIIGAGAAGLFAGALAGLEHKGKKILIMEKNSKPGIKLLLSGSGQCNFTHTGLPEEFIKHYGDKGKSVKHVLYQLTSEGLISFFAEHGLESDIREDGKVFPLSRQAEDIRNLLYTLADRGGVEFKLNQNITSIEKQDKMFNVITSRTTYKTKNILITTGGKSYQITGTNWNGYDLISSLGHSIVDLKPALCPPVIKKFHHASLMGISFKNIQMTLKKANNKKKHFQGDMLFTHFGVSGPLVLDASRFYEPGDKLIFNFTPFSKYEEFLKDFMMLIKRNPKKIIKNVLSFYPIPAALVLINMQDLNIPANEDFHNINKKKLDKLLESLYAFELEVASPGSYAVAMATNGGVSLKEINMKTMESKVVNNLYFAGEVVDVDADTGGYNIHFAFASAKLAIEDIFKS